MWQITFLVALVAAHDGWVSLKECGSGHCILEGYVDNVKDGDRVRMTHLPSNVSFQVEAAFTGSFHRHKLVKVSTFTIPYLEASPCAGLNCLAIGFTMYKLLPGEQYAVYKVVDTSRSFDVSYQIPGYSSKTTLDNGPNELNGLIFQVDGPNATTSSVGEMFVFHTTPDGRLTHARKCSLNSNPNPLQLGYFKTDPISGSIVTTIHQNITNYVTPGLTKIFSNNPLLYMIDDTDGVWFDHSSKPVYTYFYESQTNVTVGCVSVLRTCEGVVITSNCNVSVSVLLHSLIHGFSTNLTLSVGQQYTGKLPKSDIMCVNSTSLSNCVWKQGCQNLTKPLVMEFVSNGGGIDYIDVIVSVNSTCPKGVGEFADDGFLVMSTTLKTGLGNITNINSSSIPLLCGSQDYTFKFKNHKQDVSFMDSLTISGVAAYTTLDGVKIYKLGILENTEVSKPASATPTLSGSVTLRRSTMPVFLRYEVSHVSDEDNAADCDMLQFQVNGGLVATRNIVGTVNDIPIFIDVTTLANSETPIISFNAKMIRSLNGKTSIVSIKYVRIEYSDNLYQLAGESKFLLHVLKPTTRTTSIIIKQATMSYVTIDNRLSGFNFDNLMDNCSQVQVLFDTVVSDSIMGIEYLSNTKRSASQDADVSYGLYFSDLSVPSNLTLSCLHLESFDVISKASKISFTFVFNELCANTTIETVLYSVPENSVSFDSGCDFAIQKGGRHVCTVVGYLNTKDKFNVAIVATDSLQQPKTWHKTVNLDITLMCESLCFIPIVRNWDYSWRVAFFALFGMVIVYGFILFATPAVVVAMTIAKIGSTLWFVLSIGVVILKFVMSLLKKVLLKVKSRYLAAREAVKKNKPVLPVTSPEVSKKPKKPRTKETVQVVTRKGGSKLGAFTALTILCVLTPIEACSNLVLSASNVTECSAGLCKARLFLSGVMPLYPGSETCFTVNSIDTQLGIKSIKPFNVSIKVDSAKLSYPLLWRYKTGLQTLLPIVTPSCECPNGGSHYCDQNSHPASINCGADQVCTYVGVLGSKDGCPFYQTGNGHYCAAVAPLFVNQLTILKIVDPFTKQYCMSVKSGQSTTGTSCWDGNVATTMKVGSSTVKFAGLLDYSSTYDLRGTYLIRSGDQAWLDRTVNDQGEHDVNKPGWAQSYTNTTIGKIVYNPASLRAVTTVAGQHCGNSQMGITSEFADFMPFLVGEKLVESRLNSLGTPRVTGFGYTTQFTLSPHVGPQTLYTLELPPSDISFSLDNACPEIVNVVADTTHQVGFTSKVTVFVKSTCGPGEVRVSGVVVDGRGEIRSAVSLIISSDIVPAYLPIYGIDESVTINITVSSLLDIVNRTFTIKMLPPLVVNSTVVVTDGSLKYGGENVAEYKVQAWNPFSWEPDRPFWQRALIVLSVVIGVIAIISAVAAAIWCLGYRKVVPKRKVR